MSKPTREELDELLRRLQTGAYSPSDIREAAEILFSVHTHAEGYMLALDWATSMNEQVRMLGLCMMQKLAPHLDSARGFLAATRDAAKLLQGGGESSKAAGPDYSAIGEVLKVWLRDSRKSRRRR